MAFDHGGGEEGQLHHLPVAEAVDPARMAQIDGIAVDQLIGIAAAMQARGLGIGHGLGFVEQELVQHEALCAQAFVDAAHHRLVLIKLHVAQFDDDGDGIGQDAGGMVEDQLLAALNVDLEQVAGGETFDPVEAEGLHLQLFQNPRPAPATKGAQARQVRREDRGEAAAGIDVQRLHAAIANGMGVIAFLRPLDALEFGIGRGLGFKPRDMASPGPEQGGIGRLVDRIGPDIEDGGRPRQRQAGEEQADMVWQRGRGGGHGEHSNR